MVVFYEQSVATLQSITNGNLISLVTFFSRDINFINVLLNLQNDHDQNSLFLTFMHSQFLHSSLIILHTTYLQYNIYHSAHQNVKTI